MRIAAAANLLDVRMDAMGWPERRQVLIQDDRRALITGIRVRVRYQKWRGCLISKSLNVPDVADQLDHPSLRFLNRNVAMSQP